MVFSSHITLYLLIIFAGIIITAVGTGRNKKDAIKYSSVDACAQLEKMVFNLSLIIEVDFNNNYYRDC